jgi:phage terminase small subunit
MKSNKKTNEIPPPKHLGRRSKAFWRELNGIYEFEIHDLERLRVACEQIDLIDASEDAIRLAGRFVTDRYGAIKAHPGILVAKDARAMLLRALRELAVDITPPDDQKRLPQQERKYR